MNGFITESTSKITDGFGSALKLITIMALTTWLYPPVSRTFGQIGELVYFALLFGGGLFYLQRSLQRQANENQKAWFGMTAGALFWQGTRFSPASTLLGLFDQTGFIIWIFIVLVTAILWRKILPIGLRFFLLVFLLNWIGRLYLTSQMMLASWPAMLAFVYPLVRYVAAIGIFACLWWIVMRSENSIERKYGALLLYFCILLTFLFF